MKETTLNMKRKREDREDGIEMDFMEVNYIYVLSRFRGGG
jgi:hypothetical protein